MDDDTLLPPPQITTSVSGDTSTEKRNTNTNCTDESLESCAQGKDNATEKINGEALCMPSSVPSEITKVSGIIDPECRAGSPSPSGKNVLPTPPWKCSSQEDNSPDKNCHLKESNLEFNAANPGKESEIASSSMTDEESISSSTFLPDNGLRWTEKKSSRVGEEYQATFLPEAGSYLNLQGDDFDQLEQLLLADQIWDPLQATCMGINDYVHLNCPSNKKESALELLHQRDYDDSHFSDELKRLPVLDGSDWTLAEHEHFRKLMQSSRHNVHHVAKSMGKSINNCLTVYYKIINVRETRNTKKRFSGMKPIEEINELKDIGRSLRIEKRNQRKRSTSISAEDNNPKSGSKRKRKKATSASDKIKSPNSASKTSKRESKITPPIEEKSESTSEAQKSEELYSKRTSPRVHKSMPVRLADEQAFEKLYASIKPTKNNDEKVRTKEKVKEKVTKKSKNIDKEQSVFKRKLRSHKSSEDEVLQSDEELEVADELTISTASPSRTRGARAAKVQALKSLLRKTELTRKHSSNEQDSDSDSDDTEKVYVNVARCSTRTKQSSSKLLQNKGKKSKQSDQDRVNNEDGVVGTRLAKMQALKSLSSHTANDNSDSEEEKGRPERKISNFKSCEDNSELDLWERRYEELVQFKEEYGHCLVPKVYPENRQLSYWVFRQRGLYSGSKKQTGSNILSKERIQKLKDLGFLFRAKHSKEQNEVDAARRKPSLDAKWNKFYEAFLKYKEETGSCLIPKVFEENQPLSSWAFTQRHQMKRRKDGKHNLLTDERIKKLNDIGFVWHAKKNKEWQEADRIRKQAMVESMWQNHYKSLLEFKKKHGHTRVPKVYKHNQALSTWVFRQRAHYRRRTQGEDMHSLSDERLQLLEKIDFQFRVRK
mmetsp:Transcript_14477/g.21926  ORF Transcript_14477/g.21926 Transcript_14477/m.21926 type:complete len:884 (+) Transcript_14477:31-2682(+)